MTKAFTHLLQITPLGLLYGSAGGFLSPENLVGRSGNKFPPSSATISGLYAQVHSNSEKNKEKTWLLSDLCLAGPFWARSEEIKPDSQNFFVPTPFNCLAQKPFAQVSKTDQDNQDLGQVKHYLKWDNDDETWQDTKNQSIQGKFDQDSWIAIKDWQDPQKVYESPWKYLPHLHPRLQDEQRHTKEGDLFLENAVQVDPDVSLIYLTNHELENGWYRFGGEGHLVDIKCSQLTDQKILNDSVGKTWALITPAVWGSNRLSYRFPQVQNSNPSQSLPEWEHDALITERPQPFRYRLGGKLSRGRYAVPAGSVYVLKEGLDKSWYDWPKDWFPIEAYSFKRWGSGLALPLSI
jgi:CRISPR-associated protein Cmr3